jgi:hypothetical protein
VTDAAQIQRPDDVHAEALRVGEQQAVPAVVLGRGGVGPDVVGQRVGPQVELGHLDSFDMQASVRGSVWPEPGSPPSQAVT